MALEVCCQCDSPTGRAGRADDSLYTDSDWGPYCEECWADTEYWRCLTDEKVSEIVRLHVYLTRIIQVRGGAGMLQGAEALDEMARLAGEALASDE